MQQLFCSRAEINTPLWDFPTSARHLSFFTSPTVEDADTAGEVTDLEMLRRFSQCLVAIYYFPKLIKTPLKGKSVAINNYVRHEIGQQISSPQELSSSWSCQSAQRSASVDTMSSDKFRPRPAVTPTSLGNLVGRHGSASILQTTRVVPLISWVNFRVIQPGTKHSPFTVLKQTYFHTVGKGDSISFICHK